MLESAQQREISIKREKFVEDERSIVESNVRRLKTVIFCIDLHDLVKISQMLKPPRLLSILYFGLLSLFQHVLPCSNLKPKQRDWHFVQVTPHLADNVLASIRNFRKICCQGGITEGRFISISIVHLIDDIKEVQDCIDQLSVQALGELSAENKEIACVIRSFLVEAVLFWKNHAPEAKNTLKRNEKRGDSCRASARAKSVCNEGNDENVQLLRRSSNHLPKKRIVATTSTKKIRDHNITEKKQGDYSGGLARQGSNFSTRAVTKLSDNDVSTGTVKLNVSVGEIAKTQREVKMLQKETQKLVWEIERETKIRERVKEDYDLKAELAERARQVPGKRYVLN